MPWTRSAATKQSATPASKSEAALAGAAGDGEVHDLDYWLRSGFLTLPKEAPDPPQAQACASLSEP